MFRALPKTVTPFVLFSYHLPDDITDALNCSTDASDAREAAVFRSEFPV
jgi:hypothetical protein